MGCVHLPVDWHKIAVPVVEELVSVASLLLPEAKVEEVRVLSDVEAAELNTERIGLIEKLLVEVERDTACPSCIEHVKKAQEEVVWLKRQIPSYERVARLRENLRQLLSEVKEEAPLLAAEQKVKTEEKKESEVAKGVACIPCASDHFSTVAGLISDEALRMARRSGIKDEEVIRRVLRASDQLNALEREDLSVEKIAQLPRAEKDLALSIQREAAEIRHGLNNIKSVEDLEQVALKIRNVRDRIGKESFQIRLAEGKKA